MRSHQTLTQHTACDRKITQEALQKVSGDTDGDGQNTSSRNSDGNVPNVNWNSDDRKLNVNWYNPSNAVANIRARAEVSSWKEDLMILFYVSTYFIQPAAILEISWSCASSMIYGLSSIIFNSFMTRMSCFKVSIFMRN